MNEHNQEKTAVFRITPMDQFGEQDGNADVTLDEWHAKRMAAHGDKVEVLFGSFEPVVIKFVPETK